METFPDLLFIAVPCAALMGFAIQRGATCLVGAVEELVAERRAARLIALAEAALWVGGTLAALRLAGLAMAVPSGFAPGALALAGGVLLGLGAWVNRGCLFGTVARLGSGEWHYGAVPIGFYLGCLAAFAVLGPMAAPHGANGATTLSAAVLATLAAGLALWRFAGGIAAVRRGPLAAPVWSPHLATVVIGVAFVTLSLTAGPWTYGDLLVDLSRGMAKAGAVQLALFAALFGGALLGGWSAGRWRPVPPRPSGIARSLAGGFLMGLGGQLVPGGNDGLILVGLPLLQPHALAALAAMTLTIAAAILLPARIRALSSGVRSA